MTQVGDAVLLLPDACEVPTPAAGHSSTTRTALGCGCVLCVRFLLGVLAIYELYEGSAEVRRCPLCGAASRSAYDVYYSTIP